MRRVGSRSSLANCGPTGERGGYEQPDPRRTARTNRGARRERGGPDRRDQAAVGARAASRWPHRTRCPTVGSSRSCGGTPSRRTRRTRCRRSSRTCAGCSAVVSSCARGAATPWRSIPTRSTRSGSNVSCARPARSRPAASMRQPCNGSASALDLVRGEPFAELIDRWFARDAAARLEEIALSAHEGLIDSELAMGRHTEVLSTLSELVVLHPLRERFRAQLIVALYRCGRQADALAAYRTARDYLLDELGLDPGPELPRPGALGARPGPGPGRTDRARVAVARAGLAPARPDVVRRPRTRADRSSRRCCTTSVSSRSSDRPGWASPGWRSSSPAGWPTTRRCGSWSSHPSPTRARWPRPSPSRSEHPSARPTTAASPRRRPSG